MVYLSNAEEGGVMRFYRIYYTDHEGGHYEWFRTKRDAELRHRDLKAHQSEWLDGLMKPVCIEFGPNKAEMLRTLNLFCDEAHA